MARVMRKVTEERGEGIEGSFTWMNRTLEQKSKSWIDREVTGRIKMRRGDSRDMWQES
jgi:hypothetical protein